MSTTVKPRTATVVIYQGDDLARLAELRREVDAAERRVQQAERDAAGAPRRGGDEDPAAEAKREEQAARDRYDAAVDEAAERATEVTVRAIGRRKFRELMADSPPREGNDDDAAYDVNIDTFPYAFLPLSITGPSEVVGDSAAFLDGLAEGDFERLFATTYWLNRGPGSDPKDSRYSAAPLTSSAT